MLIAFKSETQGGKILPITVNSAFSIFLANSVNLAPQRTVMARNSRDAMLERINNLKNFLPLEKSFHLQFGSFARGTKIRPIDDIDLIICMNWEGLIERASCDWDNYKIELVDTTSVFKKYISTSLPNYYSRGLNQTYYLNSDKIKNAFKSTLSAEHDCSKAELHSCGEAITLKFTSYEWNFDIVPAFYVSGYYLIPNGAGGWKKTNPKLDRERTKRINSKCGGTALNLVRLTKYWNRRHTMATMPSYLLEAMVMNYCQGAFEYSKFIHVEFKNFLQYLTNNIFNSVTDPKGIQGNINTLSYGQKNSIYQKSSFDYAKACKATYAEIHEKDYTKAIKIWSEIFGGEFPTYG